MTQEANVKKIKEVFQLDEQQMANLAINDSWWQNAHNWYVQVKEESIDTLGETEKHWLVLMKRKLADPASPF